MMMMMMKQLADTTQMIERVQIVVDDDEDNNNDNDNDDDFDDDARSPFLFADTTQMIQRVQTVVCHVQGEDFVVANCLLLQQSSRQRLVLLGQRFLNASHRLGRNLHPTRQHELAHEL
jgi:hypothetical protein